ncbi:15-hydroxyprostaglandin dehydrogenase [NAD(+)]-like [Ostrinia furnacalis]|uniref:15-hydroxyprostaglandin dehydrogenase [NAD(+)]-like n=1 Tax=Ostrinia furnacalis TaxID=93504 RepID=UPI0010399855|nr:15-hydroxyprostaglandin dehydrogenase [NAD(+)]-like [Ostrinia furnacalis]
MSELKKIEGKTFLITGGASGLGAGYAQAFLENGAKSVAILDISEDAGKATAKRLNKIFPNKVLFFKCDVGNEESLTQAFNEVVDKFKTVDVIINNAGVMNDSPNMFRKCCDINYKGLVSLTFKGLEHMHKEDGGVGGTIVNISSTAAFGRFPYVPAYSGSKAGVLHFSSCLAVDPFHEVTGVRIISMCIGPTKTPIFNNMDQLSYDERSGKAMAQLLSSLNYQRPESAVSGVVEAFKQGTNGSNWFSVNDKPVKDITLAYNQAQDFLTKALNSDL